MKKIVSKWDHPDGWEPHYKKAPGQGKKPMVWRSAQAQQVVRSKTIKITLPTIKFMEDK
jgi:hypothetical protein